MKLGRFAGIDVFVHWTFPMLVPWAAMRTQGWQEFLFVLALLLLAFLCVTLHEYGHALAARRFGIGTHNITLLPIGGVAQLNEMPRQPLHELVVAVAGPLVNVAIAAMLWGCLHLIGGNTAYSGMEGLSINPDVPLYYQLLTQLLAINI